MDSEARRRALTIAAFLAPAVLVYSAIMIIPLFETIRLSFYRTETGEATVWVGLTNYITLFTDAFWSEQFVKALGNNFVFFFIHMLVQNPIAILLAAILSMRGLRGGMFYRTSIFVPTILSFVIVGFIWKLMLSPVWGVSKDLLDLVGLKHLFLPWLGLESTALVTLALISVWQFVGIPMLLIYAALLSIPDELLEAADCDGVTGASQFWKVKLPLIMPSIGLISILTFVGNFNAFDLIYAVQGALAGPNYSTDLLGTLMFRTFYGFQTQSPDPHLGATVASVMFLIILAGVAVYLFGIQRKLQRYEL